MTSEKVLRLVDELRVCAEQEGLFGNLLAYGVRGAERRMLKAERKGDALRREIARAVRELEVSNER